MVTNTKFASGKIVEDRLAAAYPAAKCALNYANAYELLVATVLSAQTTDKRVNEVTPTLFAKYPSAFSLAQAKRDELESILHPLGFFRRRAAQLQGLAAQLITDHDGQVPADRKALVALPGVGRKTANVVLGNCFGTPAITVDTHVGRLSRRLGWTTHEDPRKAENDISQVLDPKLWTIDCHRLIEHGRNICHSRNPQCNKCVLADICPSVAA